MDCTYYAKWEYLEFSDQIRFTITANHTNRWVAIGFSETTSMVLFSIIYEIYLLVPLRRRPTFTLFVVLFVFLIISSLKRTWCSAGSTPMAAPLLATCGPSATRLPN
jgi:hypothetical protein